MKASAIAHPIQGLVKYHGLKDAKQRIPYHDSISVCTGPIHTHTTVETYSNPFRRGADLIEIDGRVHIDGAADRVLAVVNAIREKVGSTDNFTMVSKNDFPQYIGLGSSSSGFAALAVAAAEAYGWKASLKEISEVARLGAGSAARSVTGGVSEWVTEGKRSYSHCLVDAHQLQGWRIIVPIVHHEEPTDNVHKDIASSPFFEARNAYVESALNHMRAALTTKRLDLIARVAERDTLNLHAVAMTTETNHLTWQPITIAVMQRVKELRSQGINAWFSIDTGATAYVNTDAEHASQVIQALKEIPGVREILQLRPAGPAHLVSNHLF